MAVVEKITLSLGETLNMGNFESFRADVSMEVRIEEGDDLKKVYDNLSKKVRSRLDYEIQTELDKETRER